MNKNKVAVFTYSLAGGGAERVAANFLGELNKTMSVELILIKKDTIVYDIPKNCKITNLSKKISHNSLIKLACLPFLSFKLYRHLKRNTIHTIVSFMEYPNWLVLFMRFFGWSGKIIISEQASPIQHFDINTIRGKIGRRLNQILYPKANKIIACSKGVKYELNEILGIKNEYEIIYNPININAIQKQIDSCTPKTFDKFTFINVAGFRSQKNHLLLVEAFANLKNKDCKLILVGKDYGDSVGKNIKKRILELQMTNKIILAGFTNNPFEYLVNANCFVLSSDYEGLPNVLLEAMYCNLQIISTDCRTGPREILAPETNFYRLATKLEETTFGYLIPTNDLTALTNAMTLVLENQISKTEIALYKKNRCDFFDLKNIGQQFVQAVSTVS